MCIEMIFSLIYLHIYQYVCLHTVCVTGDRLYFSAITAISEHDEQVDIVIYFGEYKWMNLKRHLKDIIKWM